MTGPVRSVRRSSRDRTALPPPRVTASWSSPCRPGWSASAGAAVLQGTRDLNPQPSVLETDALPVELVPFDGLPVADPPARGHGKAWGRTTRGRVYGQPPRASPNRSSGAARARRSPTRPAVPEPPLRWAHERHREPAAPARAGSPRRIGAIAESATLEVDAKAKALKAEGRPVIGFGAGEPDFPTPDYIVEAAVDACRDPKNHRYTPAGGLPELKQAIADKTRRDSGLRRRRRPRSLVTNGGKQAIYEAFATMLDPGDEVIVPAPYWTTYPEAIQLAGGVAGRGARRRDPGLQGHRRPARGRAHRPHQGAAVRLAVEPDRRRLHRRRDPGDRPLGRATTSCGWSPTRSTSTSSTTASRPARCRCCAPSWPTAASSSTASPRPTR